MEEKQLREQMERDITALAERYSFSRMRITTLNFDLDYERDDDGTFYLKSQKAIIRVMGQTTKVAIGEDEEHKTFEEAFEATKKFWQEYYREVRARRSDRAKRSASQRQRRYRENARERTTRLERQQ